MSKRVYTIADLNKIVGFDTTSGEECLWMMSRDPRLLKYVREQTPKICLAAVKENGYVLEYVKEQTPEICLAAVKQNGYA